MSRVPHEPNKERRDQVRMLSGVGLVQADISIIIGCSEKTLRLYYAQELAEGAEQANATIVEALQKEIRKQNVTAMIFFEKCRGGKRETIKEEISRSRTNDVGGVIFMPGCDLKICDREIDRWLRHDFHYPESAEECRLVIPKIKAEIAKEKALAQKK